MRGIVQPRMVQPHDDVADAGGALRLRRELDPSTQVDAVPRAA